MSGCSNNTQGLESVARSANGSTGSGDVCSQALNSLPQVYRADEYFDEDCEDDDEDQEGE